MSALTRTSSHCLAHFQNLETHASENYRFTAHKLIRYIHIIYEIKGILMLFFQQYCFHFRLVQWGKIDRACRKYSLRNVHT